MATVPDLSGNSPIDISLSVDQNLTGINASVTATPIGSRTPLYTGEMVFDTTNEVLYRAYGAANTEWEVISRQ